MAGHLNFQCALITGGAGGIGRAMAEYFIAKGKKVIIAGRTESNLKATHEAIGSSGYYVLDTGKTAEFPAFVGKVIKEHPDLDCLVNNAGVQRVIDIANEDFLQKADEEIDINIRGPMHLSAALLPHFQAKPSALIVNVSSVLGFCPWAIINPVYNATKAWLHFFSMVFRTQLAKAGSSVRVVEIAPPMVESDLHRDRDNPDDNKKSHSPIALSLEEFMDEVGTKLENGDDMISAGIGAGLVKQWYDLFGERYNQASKNYTTRGRN